MDQAESAVGDRLLPRSSISLQSGAEISKKDLVRYGLIGLVGMYRLVGVVLWGS